MLGEGGLQQDEHISDPGSKALGRAGPSSVSTSMLCVWMEVAMILGKPCPASPASGNPRCNHCLTVKSHCFCLCSQLSQGTAPAYVPSSKPSAVPPINTRALWGHQFRTQAPISCCSQACGMQSGRSLMKRCSGWSCGLAPPLGASWVLTKNQRQPQSGSHTADGLSAFKEASHQSWLVAVSPLSLTPSS